MPKIIVGGILVNDVNVKFENIEVNSITSSSGIFLGDNLKLYASSETKTNIGSIRLIGEVNRLVDNDTIVIGNGDNRGTKKECVT